MSNEFILASQSPYRKELLSKVLNSFHSESPDLDEELLQKTYRGSPHDLASYLARKKAESLRSHHRKAWILGSDQVLLFQGEALSKPHSREQAEVRLTQLQGHSHQLVTAFCLLGPDQVFEKQVISTLTMHSLSLKQIQHYLDLDDGVGCAGAYKIESHGASLFSRVETEDFFSIIGLPLFSLSHLLREEGILGP